MPVDLPRKQPTDPKLLSLLAAIARSDGRLCISDDEYGKLEDESFFRTAERSRLVRIDHGGEWMDGAVISITRAGRLLIGDVAPENIWRRLELMLRRSIGGADR